MAILWSSDKSDVASLLTGDQKATLAVLDSFEKHLVNHQSDLSPFVYQRTLGAISQAVTALRELDCDLCEAEMGLDVNGWDVLCPTCATKERA